MGSNHWLTKLWRDFSMDQVHNTDRANNSDSHNLRSSDNGNLGRSCHQHQLGTYQLEILPRLRMRRREEEKCAENQVRPNEEKWSCHTQPMLS